MTEDDCFAATQKASVEMAGNGEIFMWYCILLFY